MELINWEKLVQAEFQYQSTKCHIHAPKKCTQNYFCVSCEEEDLCAAEFESEQGRHLQHSKLQVRRNSRMYSLHEKDMREYLDTSLIQKYVCNEAVQVHIRTREPKGKSTLAPDDRPSATYEGCLNPISMSRTATGGSAKSSVCSIQCLLRKLAHPVQLADHDHLGVCAGETSCEANHVTSCAPPSAGASVVMMSELFQSLRRCRRRKQLAPVRSPMM